MPRNDQITRQWYLLRRLEGSNGLTLQALVESVPEDFPKNARTVRRDLEALEARRFSRRHRTSQRPDPLAIDGRLSRYSRAGLFRHRADGTAP